MGKKKSKKKLDKYEKQKNKYNSRKEYLLSLYDKDELKLWFKDNEKQLSEFGDYLMKLSSKLNEDENNVLDLDNGDSWYEKKKAKILKRKCKTDDDIIQLNEDLDKLKRKRDKYINKYKKYKNKDFNLASYLNSKSKYGKKALSKDKYRKFLKKIAKDEKRDTEEMRKLGYIRNKNIDDELKKIKKADKMMGSALSDSYTQKHFL